MHVILSAILLALAILDLVLGTSFLVDPASAAADFGLSIDRLVHPVVRVQRSEDGGLQGLPGKDSDAPRESMIYLETEYAEAAARKAQENGMKKVDVFVKGPGSGRETAIRSLTAAGLEVGSIQDVTPQAHNGCRPPKRRRV